MNVISLFSGCGGLRGIEDARGRLFFDYIRILKEFRPRFFLAEEAGYDVSLTMVNAKNYGVAEERKRVFYIGFRNDLHIDFVFPKGSTEDDEKKLTLRNIIWNLQETAVPAGPKNYHNPEAINNNVFHRRVFSDFHEPQQGKGLGRTGLYSAGIRSAVI